jgi:hypothetical protein
VKNFKRDTSDDDDEEEDDKKNATVAEKVYQCIERCSLQPYNPTDTLPENFIYSDFDFDDCTTADFEPQNLIAPDAPRFDYTTDNVLPDYRQLLSCLLSEPIRVCARLLRKSLNSMINKFFYV